MVEEMLAAFGQAFANQIPRRRGRLRTGAGVAASCSFSQPEPTKLTVPAPPSLASPSWEPGLTRFHQGNHCLVHRRSEPDLRRLARDRAIDRVDLRSAAGQVVEQHRGPGLGNAPAQPTNM